MIKSCTIISNTAEESRACSQMVKMVFSQQEAKSLWDKTVKREVKRNWVCSAADWRQVYSQAKNLVITEIVTFQWKECHLVTKSNSLGL